MPLRASSLLRLLLASLLVASSAVSTASAASWLTNGDFESKAISPWGVSPVSATPAVVPASISAFTGKWSMAIAQVYSVQSLTSLDDITAVSVTQTARAVPSNTPLTFSYSVAMPISYGLQAFTSAYAYDQGAMRSCSPQLVTTNTISEYNSYSCAIPANTQPGLHNVTVGFTAQSAYGYFFVDAVSLTS
jgi:hypothetical protein